MSEQMQLVSQTKEVVDVIQLDHAPVPVEASRLSVEKPGRFVLRLDQMRLTSAGVDRLARRVREINEDFERLGVPVRLKVEPAR